MQVRFQHWDSLISGDPEDNEIDIAHGFYPWETLYPLDLCRNGCGLSRIDVSSGKVLKCSAPEPHKATSEIRLHITELESEFKSLLPG